MLKLTLVAIAALASVSASAQSSYEVSSASPFSGPFIGIQGGWKQDRQRLAVDYGSDFGVSHRSGDGFAYGGQIGYDYRLTPTVVAGIEGSVTGRTGNNFSRDAFGNGYDLREGRTFNATARIGTLIRPDGLLYVRGGYSNARFDLDDFAGRTAENRDGYTVGAGYEQAITRRVSARVEYNYSDYGSRYNDGAAFDIGADSVRSSYRRNAVTAGLNFHF